MKWKSRALLALPVFIIAVFLVPMVLKSTRGGTGSGSCSVFNGAHASIVKATCGEVDTKGGDKYTGGSGDPWCSEFASWANYKEGFPLTGGEEGWRQNDSTAVKSWFKKNGTWFDKGSGDVPQPGDTITFRDLHHTGIIDHVEGTTLYTVEGNHKGNDKVVTFTYENYADTDSEPDGWGRYTTGTNIKDSSSGTDSDNSSGSSSDGSDNSSSSDD